MSKVSVPDHAFKFGDVVVPNRSPTRRPPSATKDQITSLSQCTKAGPLMLSAARISRIRETHPPSGVRLARHRRDHWEMILSRPT